MKKVINEIEIGDTWVSSFHPKMGVQCTITIDLNEIIDQYTYVFVPSSVDITLGLENMIKLRDALSERIIEMENKKE